MTEATAHVGYRAKPGLEHLHLLVFTAPEAVTQSASTGVPS